MKKSLIALAVLAASGAAMAQSSVTLFGIVDTGVAYVNKNQTGDSVYGLGTSGASTSRLGLRGTEDLGGGLKAGFWLEGEIFGDTGGSGFDFKRRSTVSLSGNFGEVRLGRDQVPTFQKLTSYDLFSATGIGQFMGFRNWAGGASGDDNGIRANNLVSYYTPNFGGFNAGIGYAFDEKNTAGTTVANNVGRYIGGYVAYDNGPLSVSLGLAQQKTVTGTGLSAVAADRDEMTLGASYNFGVAKLSGLLQQTKFKRDAGGDIKTNSYMLGASAPVGGVGEVKLQYALYDQKNIDSKAHQITLGYVHNLSKRTSLYGNLAFLKNKDRSTLGLQAKGVYNGAVAAGESQTGVQVGIRHAF
ncbi:MULTISPECIES: porin [unclassified Delftia]|uniref:porin n=1 Tax=unclassified Delftia TaxID=2613839 RepID=UPI00190100C1|nr:MULTISPECIES: porin [unclassified Delftia]MBK0111458.1 porin [Delftia sp. S65]MBK0116723.1 porin [Delftia sp. S67]MBK0128176.1 porin [Delftia sp. S66]